MSNTSNTVSALSQSFWTL